MLAETNRNTIDTKKLIVFIALLRVIIHKDDIRIKKLCRKASKLIIFLVDASGKALLFHDNQILLLVEDILLEYYQGLCNHVPQLQMQFMGAIVIPGSMAFNRMAAAKGAALTILAESYRSRNQVKVLPQDCKCRAHW